jgi:hypothetical protein
MFPRCRRQFMVKRHVRRTTSWKICGIICRIEVDKPSQTIGVVVAQSGHFFACHGVTHQNRFNNFE